MQIPLQVTFRGTDPSPAVEEAIREHAAALEKLYGRITRCRVVVEVPHKHHNKGTLYQVSVDLTVPGRELVANRERSQNHAHEDVFVAIRDAFAAVARQLEEVSERRQRRVKQHEEPPTGQVTRLFPYEGYGFIETLDGRQIYFHRNAVADGGFEKLTEGTPVRFVLAEDPAEQGPHASAVIPLT